MASQTVVSLLAGVVGVIIGVGLIWLGEQIWFRYRRAPQPPRPQLRRPHEAAERPARSTERRPSSVAPRINRYGELED